MSVSLRRRWGEQWSVDAAAGFQQDLEELLTTELGPTTMLSKLKQVDGSGSGLDADLLDGLNSTAFVQTSDYTTTTAAQTPTAGSGSFASVSATVTLEHRAGDHFYRVQVQITIATNGTAAGFINVPLGITASKESVLAGRCAAVSGKMVQGIMAATSSTLVVTLYDNTYPGSSGERITLCGIVYV